MGNRVHYFSFYLSKEMETGRIAFPASFAKVEYVKAAAVKLGTELTMVSTAMAEKGVGFLGKKTIKISENESHVYLPTFGYNIRFINKLAVLFMRFQIILYVLFNVKKNDKVLVYHSLAYINPFKLLKKVKTFKLILEFNDLYYVANERLIHLKEKEIEFIDMADSYLFMNTIAEKRFNKGKPYVISYGNYELLKRNKKEIFDGKIHVLYAGIIENGRKAAELAVKSSLYLDEKFIMHILGFGDDGQLAILNEMIDCVNMQKGYEAVIFHGRLRGKEFSDFLYSCHIGVSSHAYLPNEMDSANYTFPSKIPMYMAHDLRVVSPDIPCVVNSPFVEFTTFYHEHTGKDIAKAITECAKNVKVNKESVRMPSQLIADMDKNFCKDIKRILVG